MWKHCIVALHILLHIILRQDFYIKVLEVNLQHGLHEYGKDEEEGDRSGGAHCCFFKRDVLLGEQVLAGNFSVIFVSKAVIVSR